MSDKRIAEVDAYSRECGLNETDRAIACSLAQLTVENAINVVRTLNAEGLCSEPSRIVPAVFAIALKAFAVSNAKEMFR